MTIIADLSGREILDSRGRPTVEAKCLLASGATGIASVPSGASTGSAEAWELRDGDAARYRGLGCRRAVGNINRTIRGALVGQRIGDQAALDGMLVQLDGDANKAGLGANAILAVSLAFARAAAAEQKVPLYQYLSEVVDVPLRTLPRLTVNLFSGGKHAGGQIPIQDVLVVPSAAVTIDESLAMVFAVYQAAAELVNEKYAMRALTADEGGLAPPFPDVETMLSDAVAAIRAAGFEPGRDVALALDVAASHFFHAGHYHLGDAPLSGAAMIDKLESWLAHFPIVSMEDGLAEEDWQHWTLLQERVGSRTLVLGDDLLCTNPLRTARAIETRAANALLLKVNQIGTLSEAAQTLQLARSAGWKVTISARSGETEDHWLADLAVGWGGDQIKVGSIRQSERLAKYNRLLAIEAETQLPLVDWPKSRD